MTKLFLHIGTEKTGSTSIQRFFRANRELLKSRGFLYPVSLGKQNHTALAAAAQDDHVSSPLRDAQGIDSDSDLKQFRLALRQSLAEEIDAGSCDTVILSNEHCSSRLRKEGEVQRLRDLLSDVFGTIAVVAYIRRQDDLLLSAYSTAVKSGSTRPLCVPGPALAETYDHWKLLSRWCQIFGRNQVICRRFEKESLSGGDVVDDLLDVIGIPRDPELVRPLPANESLDAASLEFLRLFNRQIPRFAEERRGDNQIRDNIVALLRELSDGPLPSLPEAELAAFMARFGRSNARVAEEFFQGKRPDSDDALFAPRSDKRNRAFPPWLTPERSVEIVAHLWRRKQEEVNRLAERAERKERRVRRTEKRALKKPADWDQRK